MKRKIVSILAVGICICLLAGCHETPKDSIVRQKGAANMKEYESAVTKENTLAELLGTPEHYTNQVSYHDGALLIDTDAEVILPDVNSISTYSVSAKKVDQSLLDQVTQAFFEDGKFYLTYTYDKWTKDDYQEEITRLKKYKAEGNLDPYEYGKDEETGEMYFNIDEMITLDEQSMQEAPEEVVKEEVTPSFGLEYWDGKGEGKQMSKDTNSFMGVAETKEGVYSYQISYDLAPDITFKIEKRKDDVEDPRLFSQWIEGEYGIKKEKNSETGIEEDKVKEMLGISYEDAQKIAREKVEKLGWDLEIYSWDYAIFYQGEHGVQADNVLDGGYMFHFSKMIDGVPITYTSSYGGGVENIDSTLEPWSYERCDVIVGDDGIQKVEIYNPYDVGQIQTENVKLMGFDEIIKIYEQMMDVSNAGMLETRDHRTYHIKKITLGYTRIYDPNADNDTGLLVPVWDFFGGFDFQGEEYSGADSGEHSTQSYLTINGIDGTVIERNLGY